MKDALGAVQSVLILGGGSDIALATARELVKQRTQRVVLAGRSIEGLNRNAEELRAAGATDVETAVFDALDFASHERFVKEVFGHESFDLVLLAFGVLGNQTEDAANPESAVRVVESNYTGAVSVLLPIADRMKQAGHGTIAVLSSVAGVRARADNFIYGSSKAGLDAFAQGLGDSLVGTGVKVLVVRPGFVTTKMTTHVKPRPMATDAEGVAKQIVAALGKGDETVWAPGALRYVFFVMTHLPRAIFRKLKA